MWMHTIYIVYNLLTAYMVKCLKAVMSSPIQDHHHLLHSFEHTFEIFLIHAFAREAKMQATPRLYAVQDVDCTIPKESDIE